jgi:hypothetical protein
VAAVLPILGEVKHIGQHDLLAGLLSHLQRSRFVTSISVLAEAESARAAAAGSGARFIPRPPELQSRERGLEDVLRYALAEMEQVGEYPDAILYANYLHPFRPEGLFDDLVRDLRYKGLDAVFPGYGDYLNYWARAEDGGFTPVGDSLKLREHKQPLYRSLYGLGCLTAAPLIRAGQLVGGRVGILPVSNQVFGLKCSDPESDRLVEVILRNPQLLA